MADSFRLRARDLRATDIGNTVKVLTADGVTIIDSLEEVRYFTAVDSTLKVWVRLHSTAPSDGFLNSQEGRGFYLDPDSAVTVRPVTEPLIDTSTFDEPRRVSCTRCGQDIGLYQPGTRQSLLTEHLPSCPHRLA